MNGLPVLLKTLGRRDTEKKQEVTKKPEDLESTGHMRPEDV